MKKLFMLLCVFGVLSARLFAAETAPGRVLLKADFDNDTSAGLARALIAHRHVELARGAGPDGSDAIRVAYVGGTMGSERIVVGYPLGAEVDQATLSFDVRFDKDFQWVGGGKLHGLGPKNPISGGNERKPAGWSARIMFGREGRCSTYLYDQTPEKKYGIGKSSGRPVFEAGRWHHVVLQVGLNTPGEPDGFATIRIDGETVVDSRNVTYRGVGGPETQIQRFLFSTFHGGHTAEWAPVDAQGNFVTVHADYDNILVTEGIRL